jgi:hypothetical protein
MQKDHGCSQGLRPIFLASFIYGLNRLRKKCRFKTKRCLSG